MKGGPKPDDLLRNFDPAEKRFTIAARLSGPVTSAFEGPVDEAPVAPEGAQSPRKSQDKAPPYMAQSEKDANIIVFADSDIFDDRFWVRTDSYLGERVAQPIADNAVFVMSAIDNLMGSNELISLRARDKSDRPFAVVEELRRSAERRFLAEQEALEKKIDEAERNLTELQVGGPGEDVAEGGPSEQEASAIKRFRTSFSTAARSFVTCSAICAAMSNSSGHSCASSTSFSFRSFSRSWRLRPPSCAIAAARRVSRREPER